MLDDKKSILDEKDLIDFGEILKAFIRRKRLILSTAGLIFSITLINIFYSRLFKPVYEGEFVLLISDPMTPNISRDSIMASGMFEDLATNKSNYDLASLIELLKSELLLNPIANKYQISSQFPCVTLLLRIFH